MQANVLPPKPIWAAKAKLTSYENKKHGGVGYQSVYFFFLPKKK
jgi:hypothetical protein